jgi:CheY-like chemotaxis protein
MNHQAKILLIDDNKATLSGIESYLTGKYRIITAHDGLAGMNAFVAGREGIDLIITDLVMPVINGVTLIAVIKKSAPKLPIIAITGWCPHPDGLGTDAKADLVLDKPFEMEDLDQAIKRLLAQI